MKKLFIAVMAAWLLTACSAPRAEENVPTSAPIENPEQPSRYDLEDEYLSLLWNSDYGFEIYDDNDLIELGYSLCEGLDSGLTLMDILETAQNNNVSAEETGALLGAAVMTLCPEQRNYVESMM